LSFYGSSAIATNGDRNIMLSNKDFMTVSAVLGAAAVLIGAFSAHGLKDLLNPKELGWIQTGVLYHFLHTLALIQYAKSVKRYKRGNLLFTSYAFLLGIIFFSGSLYTMAILSASGLELGPLGVVTPLGGLAFVMGWLYWALLITKNE
jgi:uncharacterized membrane protein YgdD (TMEM256/DUF423 family)